MDVLHRSAITITHKKPYIDWNNYLFPQMSLPLNTIGQSKCYLITEISKDANIAIQQNWKEIFETELEGICTDENKWPSPLTFTLFEEWFSYSIADWVYDLIDDTPMHSD
jgi:hypothetical protein